MYSWLDTVASICQQKATLASCDYRQHCMRWNKQKKPPPPKKNQNQKTGCCDGEACLSGCCVVLIGKRRTLTSTGYSAYLSWRRLANFRPPNHFLWVSSGTQAHLSFVFTRGGKIHHLSEAPLSTETENWSGWGQVSELCPGVETSPMAPPSCPARLSKLPSSTAISLMFLTRCPACLSVTIQYRYPPPPKKKKADKVDFDVRWEDARVPRNNSNGYRNRRASQLSKHPVAVCPLYWRQLE